MKKLYFLATLLCFNVYSQSVAPDFTVTDIEGNSHTLSNYLAQGKKIILHFFSVGCASSWKEKLRGYYEDRYIAYGPLGSNELMILYVEDNPNNTLDEVNGVNQIGLGNWTEGISYPIIVGSSLGSLYNITYEPDSRKICPNNDCNLIGVQNFVKALETDTGFCSDSGSFVGKIKNYGKNNVSNLKINLKENGVVIKTKLFNGDIPQFSTQEISFDSIEINESSEYSIEVISVNNQSNHNSDFSKAKLNFHFSKPIVEKIKIKIHTYICPQNMKCNILDSENNIVESFGPYIGNVPEGMCGGIYANSIIEHEFVLPDKNECYSVQLLSLNGGTGWKNTGYNYVYQGNVTPGIEIYSNDDLLLSKLVVGSFGNQLNFDGVFNKIVEDETRSFDGSVTIYPNPVHDVLNITTKDTIQISSVSIYNTLGQLVVVIPNAQNTKAIDVSNLTSGNYFIKINSDKGTSNTKFIKQ